MTHGAFGPLFFFSGGTTNTSGPADEMARKHFERSHELLRAERSIMVNIANAEEGDNTLDLNIRMAGLFPDNAAEQRQQAVVELARAISVLMGGKRTVVEIGEKGEEGAVLTIPANRVLSRWLKDIIKGPRLPGVEDDGNLEG